MDMAIRHGPPSRRPIGDDVLMAIVALLLLAAVILVFLGGLLFLAISGTCFGVAVALLKGSGRVHAVGRSVRRHKP